MWKLAGAPTCSCLWWVGEPLGRPGYSSTAPFWGGGVQDRPFTAFAQRVQERVANLKRTGLAPFQAQEGLVVEQLGRLASLEDSGALTEEEFQVAKRKLLGL